MFSYTTQAFADTDNYCHDPEKNAHWEEQVRIYSQDPAVLTLYALRRGLCAMIDEGKISLEMAIEIFDLEKVIIIQKRHFEDLRKAPPKKEA